jgi:hypothetical protein
MLANEAFGHPFLSPSPEHLRGSEPTKVFGECDVEQEAGQQFGTCPENMKLGSSESDAAFEALSKSPLAVLKAWRDFSNEYVAVSEVGVAIEYLFDWTGLVETKTTVFSDGFHRDEGNLLFERT